MRLAYLNFELAVASPEGFEPDAGFIAKNFGHVTLSDDPSAVVSGADVVVTDTWASMGQEEEKGLREKAFEGYCVDASLMQLAKKDAIFMHCLPAYRGQEVTAEVFEGAQSVVFQEAENRLHAQKALLEYLLGA